MRTGANILCTAYAITNAPTSPATSDERSEKEKIPLMSIPLKQRATKQKCKLPDTIISS